MSHEMLFPFINWRYYAAALSLESVRGDGPTRDSASALGLSTGQTGHTPVAPRSQLRICRDIRKVRVEHPPLRPALTSECEPPV